MEHYVTLFDGTFLPQGLALHASLERHAGPFTLWVLCMDARAQEVLESLGKSTIRTIPLAEIETPELLTAKASRQRVEYYWTLTPFTPQAVFDRDPAVRRVTYIDADVWLLKSPQPIFDEFERSGKAVLITDHAYDPEFDQSATSGQYCVQFMTFVRNASEPVMRWWQERCLEWCFARVEEGKFGDQKYLDEWPTRFPGLVHVLTQLDVLLAPWNARRFPYSRAIAWHFHGLRLLGRGKVLLHGRYPVPEIVHQRVYEPYVRELRRNLDVLGGPVVQTRAGSSAVLRLKGLLRTTLRSLRVVRDYYPVRNLPE